MPVCKCELKHITKSAVSGQRAFILSLYSYPFISIHVHLLSSRHIHFDDIINVVPKSSIHFPFLSASVPASSHLRFSSLLRGVFFFLFLILMHAGHLDVFPTWKIIFPGECC